MKLKKENKEEFLDDTKNKSLLALPTEVQTVLNELPESKRKTILQALSVSIKRHSGPLPDGENIKIYNQEIPNGGERIMTTVEKQLDHRIFIEKVSVRRSYNQSSTGQWMGFIIAISFGALAWDLAKSGQEILAGIFGTVDLVGLVTVFYLGKKAEKK